MPRRTGWDARRRNRNRGQPWRGHGANNRMCIPDRGPDYQPFWATLTSFQTVKRDLAGKPFFVLVEPTREDCVHCCTVEDVFRLLRLVPVTDIAGLGMVILRQPKRKEQGLSPVWGRLAYEVDFPEYQGPAVILEALAPTGRIRWERSLDPDARRELERLAADGHLVRFEGRGPIISTTLESNRATQLYRTLLHEVGHWVDFQRSVAPSREAPWTWLRLHEEWRRKPRAVREACAHAYADSLAASLRKLGLIPFERMLENADLVRDVLREADFVP